MATDVQPKTAVQQVFNDFCEYNTLHGVRYFAVPVRHWSERLWWGVAILLALCLSFLMIHSFWLEWQKYPTTVTEANEINPVSKIPFPTVMICPPTKIVRDKFDLSSKFDSNNRLLPNVSHADKMRLLELTPVCPQLRYYIPIENVFADVDIFNVIQDVAPTVEETTLSCSWKGVIIRCSEYLEPVMTRLGVCYTFNGLNSRDIYTDVMATGVMISKSNRNVSRWSMETGYDHEFGNEEYPMRVTDSDQISTLEIDLVIDKRNDQPLCPMTFEQFTVYLMPPYATNTFYNPEIGVPLSQDTHIFFEPTLTTTSVGLRKYSPKPRKCYFQSERKLRFFKTYSKQNCKMECWANVTKQHCGCVDFSMARDNDTKICGVARANCYREAAAKTKVSTLLECHCLSSCTSIDYTWETKQSPLNVIDSKQLNETHRQARLRVTLQTSQVKIMERVETVTVIDFLVVCGGVLGLFMGFSVLSVVELIYYPFLRLYCTIQRMKEEDDDDDDDQSDQNAKKAKPNDTSNDNENRANTKIWKIRLRSFLIEYCANSNIHGLRYFAQRNLHRVARSYWAISCVVSLSLCAWMTYNVWILWQTSPVLIRTATEKETAYTIPLPTVTICPDVKTMKPKLDLSSALNNLPNLSNIETQRLNALANVCPLLPNAVAFEDKFANESVYDSIQDIAPQFWDTLYACKWNGRPKLLPCSTRITPVLTDEGLCFAFNALNSHEMYTNEMAPGMKIVTGNRNISHWSPENGYDHSSGHKDEYPTRMTLPTVVDRLTILLLTDKRHFEHQCNRFNGGFKLILTPPGEVLKMSRNNFAIHLKKYNSIKFDVKVTKASNELRSYTPDQRQCFFQSESRLRFFRMYTEANCEEECLANFTSAECGCVHFAMPRDNKTKVCGGASVACLKAAARKLRTDESGSAFHSECNCLPACVSIKYKPRIQRSHTDLYKDNLKDTGILGVNINKVDADERIERFTVIDFLAYCGGLFGMFMGISFLSIIEIVFFVTLRLFWIIRSWKLENSVAPLNQESVETENSAAPLNQESDEIENSVAPLEQKPVEMITIEDLE